jgi:hypothetical protein
MARPFSKPFLESLTKGDTNQPGVVLGRLAVDANIPASYLAKALGVTRMSIYSWFRGKDIRYKKRKEVEALIDIMRADFTLGVLPAKSQEDAKKYVYGLLGCEEGNAK